MAPAAKTKISGPGAPAGAVQAAARGPQAATASRAVTPSAAQTSAVSSGRFSV